MSAINRMLNLTPSASATLVICSLFSPLLLSGCVSQPIAAQPQTIQLQANQSIIVGHKVNIPYYRDIYLYATDKDLTALDPTHHFSRPKILEAGENQLKLWCQHGAYQASNVVSFTAEKQKYYQVGINYQAQPNPQCYMWIFDSQSLDIVSAVVKAQP